MSSTEVGHLPREGDTIAGKYRVERILGMGGMGVVVAAHHVGLDTKVAIKFLLPEMLLDFQVVERFAREARALAKLKTEHVARVLDIGTLDTGAPYIVMEFLEGGDLASWLEQKGPLPIEQAIEFVLHACVALAEAHAVGIVHRDVKPANLFWTRRPDGQLSIKVLDFGIAKLAEGTAGSARRAMSMTKAKVTLGSPLYMSPEQMQSAKDADGQSDVWALGVILYELLTGSVPFDGASATALAVKIVTQPAPSPRLLRPEIPPELDAVILKCLVPDRRNRTADVAELARGLAPFAPQTAMASIERITGTILAARSSSNLPSAPAASSTTEASRATATEVAHETTVHMHRSLSGTTTTRYSVRTSALVVFAVGLASIGVVLAVLRTGSTPPSLASSRPEASGAPPEPVPTHVATAPGPSAVSTLPVSPLPLPPSTSTVPDGGPSPALAHPRNMSHAASPPAAPLPTQRTHSASPNCDPPYTLDAQGNKLFKHECFLTE